MQQAVLQCFPDQVVEYKFYNRRPDTKFNRASFEWFKDQVDGKRSFMVARDIFLFW